MKVLVESDSQIICLIKMETDDRRTDRHTEMGDLFFRTLGGHGMLRKYGSGHKSGHV